MLLVHLACLAITVVSATGDISGNVPKHYEHIEKFRCTEKIDVFLDRGALHNYPKGFLETWPGNNDFDCRTAVHSKAKNSGVIVILQRLTFRKESDTCKDYLKFHGDGTLRCDEFLLGLKQSKKGKLPPPPEFISSFSGLFSNDQNAYIEKIYNSYGNVAGQEYASNRFVTPGAYVIASNSLAFTLHISQSPDLDFEEELHYIAAFTAFQDCEETKYPDQMFNCGYGVCILNIFVNDGVVNCPFGDCRDEGGCENAIRMSPLLAGVMNATEEPVVIDSIGHPLASKKEGQVMRAAHDYTSIPMAYALQSQGLPSGIGIRDIGEELRAHNGILSDISKLLRRGVEVMEGSYEGKMVNSSHMHVYDTKQDGGIREVEKVREGNITGGGEESSSVVANLIANSGQ